MNENDIENIDSQNDTETTENEPEELSDLSDEDTESESVEDLRKELATLNAQKEHWKKKANEKRETPVSKPETGNLSTKDTIALIEAKVSSEDFDEVVEYATYRKVTVAEALKSRTLKTILDEKAELRQTALATQTRSPRSSSKPAGDTLIEKAKQGQLPDKDSDIEALAEARMARRLAQKE